MPRFLRIVLPLALVFALGFVFEYRAEVGADETRFLTQEAAVIERGTRRVESELETARGDLFLVADLVTGAIGDESPQRLDSLEGSLLALVRRRPDYVQVRFLGADGREVVRVEQASDGPRVVPEDALQHKGKRDYFTRTMRVAAGEVFVSPMELNVERGVLQEPYQPVVRLATPIDDATGQRRGIVVLNAHGGRFLRAFERSAEGSGVQRMIVDSDGYWLRHRPEFEWGFALEHARSFERAYPEVWEQMAAGGQGRIESSDGLFLFDTVSLRRDPASTQPPAERRLSWVLISWVPQEVLDGISVPVATRLLVIAMPLLFALLVVGLLLAAALERRRLADEALRSLERVRSVMLTAALDAIVVMDESGTTLEFNPSAQQIFGYTLDEARGKPVVDLIIPPTYREAHRSGLAHYLATGEGPIIDKHIDDVTGIRKNGEEFPVELTVCTINVMGRRLFFGFLRDLSDPAERDDGVPEEVDDDVL